MASNFAIVGGRKMGKTSILQRVHARLGKKDPQYPVVYPKRQDIGIYQSDPASFRNMILNRQREAGDKKVVVLIDEVDAILKYDVENDGRLFETFRSLSEEGRCNFVFCGGKTLYQHIHHPESPLFDFCRVIRLGRLDPESAREIIVRPMHEKKVRIGDEVVNEIIRISSCHPNLVQYICYHLIQQISSRRARHISLEDLRTLRGRGATLPFALGRVRHISLEDLRTVTGRRDFYEYFIRTTWGDATPLEKIITLCMLNRRSFTEREVYTVLEQYGLQDRQAIKEALDTLELYCFFTKGKKRYHYTWIEFPRIVRGIVNVEDMIGELLSQIRQ